MDSPGVRRRRLVSATYEAGGAASKQLLQQHPVAVFHTQHDKEEIARLVAGCQKESHPFYMMDVCEVEMRVLQWTHFLPHVVPFYPLKCNADPLLLQMLTKDKMCQLQVSTLGELECALSLVDASRISFHSLLTTRKTLRVLSSLPSPLHSIIVESEEAVEQLFTHAPHQPIIIRVTLSPDSDRCELGMGMCVEEAMECIPRLINDGANIVGISVQLWTEEEDMLPRCEALCILLQSLSVSCAVRVLDVGGGAHSSPLHSLALIYQLILTNSNCPNLQLMASPGRYFAASAFSLVTSVIGKHSIHAPCITNDVSDDGCTGYVYSTDESVYGAFGGVLMGDKPQCTPLNAPPRSAETHASAILGHAFDPIDCPQRRATLPALSIGDLLLWKNMGAYGEASEDECAPPVYYFTERAQWERLQTVQSDPHFSDARSDGGDSDTESLDDDDMADCFHRVFDD